jgi:hypothetical protein
MASGSLPNGMRYVVVELVVANTSAQTFRANNISLGFGLKDNTGLRYDLNGTPVRARRAEDGVVNLNSGERQRLELGFQVPEDVSQMVLAFDISQLSQGTMVRHFVALGAEGALLPPPPPFPGEAAPHVQPADQPVQVDNLQFGVIGISAPERDVFGPPYPGNRFLAVDVTVTNVSADRGFIWDYQYLKDDRDTFYCMTQLTAPPDFTGADAREVAPGETVQRRMWFQAPVDAQQLWLVLQKDSNDPAGKVFVALPH